jgi:hypothetical protein
MVVACLYSPKYMYLFLSERGHQHTTHQKDMLPDYVCKLHVLFGDSPTLRHGCVQYWDWDLGRSSSEESELRIYDTFQEICQIKIPLLNFQKYLECVQPY